MDKNKFIKENLEYHLRNSIQLFNEQFSFPNLVKQELDNFDNITWLPSKEIDVENFKKKNKNELIELLNDIQLHSEIEYLIKELVDISAKKIQNDIEHQLIKNLSSISLHISEKKKGFKLNLLFLEHDYDHEAWFHGFDDSNYTYKLLSGQEYLTYDYKKELFSGVGRFDYTNILSPYLKFEEEIGEEKVDMINEALIGGSYLEEVKKLFLLNGFLGIHFCLDRIKQKVRRIDIPMRDEVFIFANERECEQLNIYVL